MILSKQRCPDCNGTGRHKSRAGLCDACHGEGKRRPTAEEETRQADASRMCPCGRVSGACNNSCAF